MLTILISGCMGAQGPSPDTPGDRPLTLPVLIEEKTWDLEIQAGASVPRAGTVGGSNANCVAMRQFVNTNITAIEAEVTYTDAPLSAPEYRLKATLYNGQMSLSYGTASVVGSNHLELRVELAEFWENRSDDMRASINLWPHGEPAWSVSQPFQMAVRIFSTTPDDEPPLSNVAGCAG